MRGNTRDLGNLFITFCSQAETTWPAYIDLLEDVSTAYQFAERIRKLFVCICFFLYYVPIKEGITSKGRVSVFSTEKEENKEHLRFSNYERESSGVSEDKLLLTANCVPSTITKNVTKQLQNQTILGPISNSTHWKLNDSIFNVTHKI